MLLVIPGSVSTGLIYTHARTHAHSNRFFNELAGGSQSRLDTIYWKSPKNTADTVIYDYAALSGYVPWLVAKLKLEGIKTTFLKAPPKLEYAPEALTPLTLRFYQTETVDAFARHRRGIAKLPTGTGKTRTAAGIILSMPRRWLYLVHRRALKSQTIKALKELGVNAFSKEEILATQTQGGKWYTEPCVLVATWMSLVNPSVRSLLWDATGLIVDEVHRAAGDKYLSVVLQTVNADIRVGLSATPLARNDGRDVLTVGALGPIIYERTAKDLANHGAISKGHVIFHDYEETLDLGHIKKYSEAYKKGIAHSEARNKAVCDVAENVMKPALILVRDVVNGHGQALCKDLESRGLKTAFIHGSHVDEVREAGVEAMTSGEVDVLVSTLILEEGVDMPNLKSLIVAAGGKSAIQAIQREGRPIRKHASKDTFELHDFKDTSHPWFEAHTEKRAAAYASVGFALIGMQMEKTEEDWDEEEEYTDEVREFAPTALPESWDTFGVVKKGPEPAHPEVIKLATKQIGKKLLGWAVTGGIIWGLFHLLQSC